MYLNLITATQIIIESLPISSSTHVRLMELFLLRLGYTIPSMPINFDYLLHGPTILILALFFRHSWFTPLRLLIQPSLRHKAQLIKIIGKIFGYTIIATIPPALFMFGILKPWLKHTSFYNTNGLLVGGLLVTMLLLFSLRWIVPHVSFDRLRTSGQSSSTTKEAPNNQDNATIYARPEPVEGYVPYQKLTNRKAFILGIVQALALLPGISRFASTYVIGRWLGLNPRRSFECSFLIGAPLFIGAFLLGIHDSTSWQWLSTPSTILTFISATIGGYLGLWFMWLLAQRNLLWTIGWYLPLPMAIILFTYFY